MAVSKEDAARIALALANRIWSYPREDEDLVILHQHTKESDAAYAFTYNTRAFATSGDVMHSLIGNGAIVVCKSTGNATQMPSAYGCQAALQVWQTQQVR